MRRRKIATGLLGIVLSSPLNLTLEGVLPQGAAWPLAVVFLMDALGIVLSVRGLGAGLAAALVSIANVPLLWSVGVPVAGPWASLFALPKYAALLGVGWWGWSRGRDQSKLARWAGAFTPTVSWIYIFVSPFVSAALGRRSG